MTSARRNRKVVLVRRPQGMPLDADFDVVDETVRPPPAGGVLVQVDVLSITAAASTAAKNAPASGSSRTASASMNGTPRKNRAGVVPQPLVGATAQTRATTCERCPAPRRSPTASRVGAPLHMSAAG